MYQRPLTDLKILVLHHSATSEKKTVKNIREIHLGEEYSDIGYHYLITQESGRPELKPGRDINYNGAHTLPDFKPYTNFNMNECSIGLCIIGSFESKDPSPAVINETAYAIKLLCKKYKIPLDKQHVLPHKSVSATACPGKNTFDLVWAKIQESNKPATITPFKTTAVKVAPVIHTPITTKRILGGSEKETVKSNNQTKQGGNNLMGILTFFLKLLFLVFSAVIGTEKPGEGASKKAEAIQVIKAAMSAFGLTVPGFLSGFVDTALGFLIDNVVKFLNNNSVFHKIEEVISDVIGDDAEPEANPAG